jgi:hypothetical protein
VLELITSLSDHSSSDRGSIVSDSLIVFLILTRFS